MSEPRFHPSMRKSLDAEVLLSHCTGKSTWRIRNDMGETFAVVSRHLKILEHQGLTRRDGKKWWVKG
jgi:hypothetical protein